MTGPRRLPDPAPSVAGDTTLRTSAGTPVTAVLMLTNNAPEPRVLAVTAMGVDAEWLPHPIRTRPVLPGQSEPVEVTVSPALGAVPARYPMAVAVQALDPITGEATAPPALAELVVVLDAPGQVSISLTPVDSTAVFGRRIDIVLRNAGGTPASVDLETRTPTSTRITLRNAQLRIAPGETVRVAGRISARRARMFGSRVRHAYTITARSAGAPRHAQGSFTARAALGPTGTKVTALLAVVAIWVALAIVFIPKIADHFKSNQNQTLAGSSSTTGSGSNGGSGSGGNGGSGSGGGSGGSGSGGSGNSGGSGTPAGASASQLSLNGTISGISPSNVIVNVTPTTFNDALGAGAQPVGVATASARQIGKISSEALPQAAPASAQSNVQVLSSSDGSWSIPPLPKRGYYLLTFEKTGFQTVRYVVDASSAASGQPLKVTMNAGEGKLNGTVAGPGGALGAATITITDGHTTTTTTTDSRGAIGTWSVQGLSTPASYLVTASYDGLSTESRMVTLGPAGSASVALTLKTGVVSLTGRVTGTNDSGQIIGLGGATITAMSNTTSRTVSTLTEDGVAGNYILPDLPAGAYTVTIAADGYTSQTSGLTLAEGSSSRTLSAQLTPATGVVFGVITGTSALGTSLGGQVGAGLVLTSPDNSYKTTTTSDPAGSFTFNGVTPGTYQLTASMFSFTPKTVTLITIAGGRTEINLDLASLIGGTLPATATVTGTAQDARSLGPVTDQTSPGVNPYGFACAADGKQDGAKLTQFTLTAQVTDPIPPSPSDPNPQPATYCTNFLPTEHYTLPDKTLNPDAGLLPGLHTVTVSAPGFEPAQVQVVVPLAGTITAPIASLYPAPKLTGNVITQAKRLPTGPTCIWTTGSGVSTPSPACSATGCPAISDPTTASCTTPLDGSGNPTFSGSYSLTLPAHGIYSVFAASADSDYDTAGSGLATTPIQIGFGQGAVVSHDFALHRFGILDVTLKVPGPSGNLQVLTSASSTHPATVNAIGPTSDCNASTPQVATGTVTDNSGTTTLDGPLNGTYALQGTFTDANNKTQSGCVTAFVGLDQEVSAALPLTNPIGSFVGRLVYPQDGGTQPAAGVQVTVTGIYAYSGDTALTRSWTMTTDAQGCFAIHSSSAPADAGNCTQINAEDPTVTPATTSSAVGYVVGVRLLSEVVSVSSQPAGFQPFQVGPIAESNAVNTFTLSPNPVTLTSSGDTNTLEALPVSAGAPTGATVSVVRASDGTGGGIQVKLSADADTANHSNYADLTWFDPAIGVNNQVVPGTYTLTATLAGYVANPATATLSCVVLPTAGCTLTAFVLNKQATITITTVDSATKPVDGAVISLYNGSTLVNSLSEASTSNSVTFDNIAPDGTTHYTVGIKAAGYAFTSNATLDCGGGATAIPPPGPGDTPSCTATLAKLGTITGTVTGVVQLASSITAGSTPTTSPIANATVTAQHCTHTESGTDPIFGGSVTYCTSVDGTPFSATAASGADGGFTITGTTSTEGLAAGDYLVRVSGTPGWCAPSTTTKGTCPATLPATVGSSNATPLAGFVVTIPDATTAGADLTTVTVTPQLFEQPAVAVFNATTLQGNKTNPATGLTLTITDPTGNDASPTTAVESPAGTYTFADVLPGTYTFSASSDVYSLTTHQQQITVGGGPYPFTIGKTNNEVKGTISGLQNADTLASGLAGAQVSVVVAGSGACTGTITPVTGNDGKPLTAPTDANGQYDFTVVPNATQGTKYQVCAARYGYVGNGSTAFPLSNNASSTQNLTLTRVTHNVRITLSALLSADDISGISNANLNASSTNGPSNAQQANVSITPKTTDKSVVTISAPNVPYGCWTLQITLPDGHYGTLSSPSGVTPSPDSATLAGFSCATSEFEVPGSGATSTAVTLNYTLNEYQLTINTTATAIAPDSVPAITVTAGTFYTHVISAPVSGTRDQEIVWVAAGTFTVAGAVPQTDSANWTVTSSPASGSITLPTTGATPQNTATATLTLHEIGGGVQVTVTGASSGDTATVALACSGTGCPTAPASQSDNGTGQALFSGLPISSGLTWTVTATLDGNSVSQGVSPTGGTTTSITVPSANTTPTYFPATLKVSVVGANGGHQATVALHCSSTSAPGSPACPSDQSQTSGSLITFSGLVPGSYTVSATLDGTHFVTQDVTLTSDLTLQISMPSSSTSPTAFPTPTPTPTTPTPTPTTTGP